MGNTITILSDMMQDLGDDIVSIAEHYDIDHQELKLLEEMGELADAIGDGEESAIVEETADVMLVLFQTAFLRDRMGDVMACMSWKAKRTLMRIDAEEADGR